MKTTLNQIKALEPNQGKFLDLISYQAKTTPDDVEFPVIEILNATDLETAVFWMQNLIYKPKYSIENYERFLDFQTSFYQIIYELIDKSDYQLLGTVKARIGAHVSFAHVITKGLKFIEDRFERQETEKIIAAKFLQHFKS